MSERDIAHDETISALMYERAPDQMTPAQLAVKRTMVRIVEELETIREEGFDADQCWFALDRFAAIAEIAGAAAKGDERACCIGMAVRPEFFDGKGGFSGSGL